MARAGPRGSKTGATSWSEGPLPPGRARRAVPRVAKAAALALIVIVPALIPYARLGCVRSLDEVALYSAAARDYLATPARIPYAIWSARFFGGTTALFPGLTAILLAGLAIVTGVAFRNTPARMALAFGLAGIALSVGPSMPGGALLYRLFLPLEGIRNVARFGYLAIVAAAILAGFGVAWIRTQWPHARWMPAATVAIFVCANLDAFSAPLTPDSFVDHARDLARFPDRHAIDTLRAIGVTHVFVHDRALREWTDNETADAVPTAPGLKRLDTDGDVTLYEVIKTTDGPS